MLLRVVAQSLKPVQSLANVEKVATTPNNVASVFTGLYLALRTLKRFKAFAWTLVVLKKKKKKPRGL